MMRNTDYLIFSALLAAEIPTIAAQGVTTTITETVTLSSTDCEAKRIAVREQYAGKEVSEAVKFQAAMDAVTTECGGSTADQKEGKGDHHGKGHHHGKGKGHKGHHRHQYLHVCDKEWTALKTKYPFPDATDEKAWFIACEADTTAAGCKAEEEKLKETCKEKAKACMDEAKPIAEALREAMKEENQTEIDAEEAKLAAMEDKCPGITQQVKEGCKKGKGGKGRGKGGKGRGKGKNKKHGKGKRGAVEKAKGRVRMPVNSFPENPTEVELEVTETAVKKGLAKTVGVQPEVVTIEKLSVVAASLRKAMLRALQTGSRFLDITYAITVDSDAQGMDVIQKLSEPNAVAELTQETNAALQADALNFPDDTAPTVTNVETVEEPEVVYEHTSNAASIMSKGFISTLFFATVFYTLVAQ